MNRIEKIGVLILLIAAAVFGGFWIYDQLTAKKIVPAKGGTFVEGIIGNSQDFKPGRLTLAGLTKFDQNGKVVSDLAESWEIADEGRTYRFKLRQNIDCQQVTEIANQNIEKFGEATVASPEPGIVQFVLTEPLVVFLAATTEPLFPYGPYKIERQAKDEIQFVARQNYHLGEPNIAKIILRFYSDPAKLKHDLEKGEIMAAQIEEKIDGLESYNLQLPRTVSVFLNLRRDIFHDREFRQKFVEKKELGKPGLNLTLVYPDTLESQAQAFQKRVQKQGVNLELISDEKTALLKNYIAPRNFDLLLFGVDLGSCGDFYPFWHSSQIADPGSNFSGVTLPGLDKVLEDYRTNQNEDERQKDLEQIKQLIAEQYAEIPLESVKFNYQVSNKVQGVVFPTLKDASDRFTEVYLWYIRTKKVR